MATLPGLSPENVLMEMVSLDGKKEDEVLALLGKPKRYPVIRLVDNRPTPVIPNAPDYVVSPVDFTKVPFLLGPGVRVSQFRTASDIYGRSFKRDRCRMRPECTAPEMVAKGLCSMSVDLWSLGCAMFRIRVGTGLLVSRVHNFESCNKWIYFDYVLRVLPRPPSYGLRSKYDSYSPRRTDRRRRGTAAVWRRRQLAILRRTLRKRLRDPDEPSGYWPSDILSTPFSSVEVRDLTDLLERLLRHLPHDRLPARDALQHPWLRTLDDH